MIAQADEAPENAMDAVKTINIKLRIEKTPPQNKTNTTSPPVEIAERWLSTTPGAETPALGTSEMPSWLVLAPDAWRCGSAVLDAVRV
jgi:hypothetical protein